MMFIYKLQNGSQEKRYNNIDKFDAVNCQGSTANSHH